MALPACLCLPVLQARQLGRRLALNHVLWGVAIGLVLSLSKIGPKWLDPGGPVGTALDFSAERLAAGFCLQAGI